MSGIGGSASTDSAAVLACVALRGKRVAGPGAGGAGGGGAAARPRVAYCCLRAGAGLFQFKLLEDDERNEALGLGGDFVFNSVPDLVTALADFNVSCVS